MNAGFVPCPAGGAPAARSAFVGGPRRAPGAARAARVRRTVRAAAGPAPDEDEAVRRERAEQTERMRARLEGLFGARAPGGAGADAREFDGERLRELIKQRWGVQYDVQPQKRHGRVYIQVMWRYFEQQSFYLAEDEFASHCQAVAELLTQWDAVEFFTDYVTSTKKRPVVGITINIPIPGIDAATAAF